LHSPNYKMFLQKQAVMTFISENSSAVKRLKYIIAINRIKFIVNSRLIKNNKL